MAVQGHILARKKPLLNVPYSVSGKTSPFCNLVVGQPKILYNQGYVPGFSTTAQLKNVQPLQEAFGRAHPAVRSPTPMFSGQPCERRRVIIEPVTQDVRGTITIDQVITRPGRANMTGQIHDAEYPFQKRAVAVDEADAQNVYAGSRGELANAPIAIKKTPEKMIEVSWGDLGDSHIAGFAGSNTEANQIFPHAGSTNLKVIDASSFAIVANLMPGCKKSLDLLKHTKVLGGDCESVATTGLFDKAAIGIDEPEDPSHLWGPFFKEVLVDRQRCWHNQIIAGEA